VPESLALVVNGCKKNATELLSAAESLLSTHHRIAYHLALLSLEEIGKSDLAGMNYLATSRGKRGFATDDHVKKLFWAIWSPIFSGGRLRPEDMENYRGMARRLHETRLRSLYASASTEDYYDLSAQVGLEEVTWIIGAAKARLVLMGEYQPVALSEDQADLLNWFLSVTDNFEERQRVFGAESVKKLEELADANAWLERLHKEALERQRESLALTEAAINDKGPSEGEENNPKWRLRFRLCSESHSLRPASFTSLNSTMPQIFKFLPVDKAFAAPTRKKQEFIVEMTIPKHVEISKLYDVSYHFSKLLVLAFNIATSGLFWFNFPDGISSFMERLIDLDGGHEVKLGLHPSLSIDWGRQALSDEDIRLIGVCFMALIRAPDKSKKCLEAYFNGLAVLSKTDLHFRMETSALEQFFQAISEALKLQEKWNEELTAVEQFREILQSHPCPEFDQLMSAINSLVSEGNTGATLGDVAVLKVLTDAQLLGLLLRETKERVTQA